MTTFIIILILAEFLLWAGYVKVKRIGGFRVAWLRLKNKLAMSN